MLLKHVWTMKGKPTFCISCKRIVNKSTKPSRSTWRDVSVKRYKWLDELLKAQGVQLESEMIICNKCRKIMYKENKRRRYEVPHLIWDNVVDDRDESETVDRLPSFTDFFTVNKVMGNGDDFYYCIMCMKMGNPMRQLSTSERMILLCDLHLYSSPAAQRCITICCEVPCQRTL